MLIGSPVSWGSKKQSSVSLSTSEAEYIALSLDIQEGKWIHCLLCEILAAVNRLVPELTIFDDNQSCIKMTKNPVNHGRAKHIDIKYHHIRDEIKRCEVKLKYCETSVMLADGHHDQGTLRTSSPRFDGGSWNPCEFELRGRIMGCMFNPNSSNECLSDLARRTPRPHSGFATNKCSTKFTRT